MSFHELSAFRSYLVLLFVFFLADSDEEVLMRLFETICFQFGNWQ